MVFSRFAQAEGERIRHRYEKVEVGRPSSHSEDTCVYCLHGDRRTEAVARQRLEEVELLFEDAGVGRPRNSETDPEDMDMDEGSEIECAGTDTESIADTPYIFAGPCHGVLDIVFTGLTEERHGNAWCQ